MLNIHIPILLWGFLEGVLGPHQKHYYRTQPDKFVSLAFTCRTGTAIVPKTKSTQNGRYVSNLFFQACGIYVYSRCARWICGIYVYSRCAIQFTKLELTKAHTKGGTTLWDICVQ